MAQRRGGLTLLKIDGTRYDLKSPVVYDIASNGKRKMITGQDGVHGFAEEPYAPYIELSITDGADVDMESLHAVTDSTVTAELSNGKVIVLRNACLVNGLEGNSEEGELNLRFEGLSATEI